MKRIGLLLIGMVLMAGMAAAQAPIKVQNIVIPGPEGVPLKAKLYVPLGPVHLVGVVALHGCAGPLAKRDDNWALHLASRGHPVILPDSFGSRSLGSQCRARHRSVTPFGLRRQDAFAAARYLVAQPYTPAGGVALLGWSDGGATVLNSIAAAPDLPPGLIRGAVALYPACARVAKLPHWRAALPLLILMGADDDWTPPAPCHALATRQPRLISMQLYPGAYHDFDVPRDPVHLVKNLVYTKSGTGIAHAGENPAARDAARQAVPLFLAGLPPAG
jgi:dienelactone hydrolase